MSARISSPRISRGLGLARRAHRRDALAPGRGRDRARLAASRVPTDPLREALDLETGLPLILLPEGFQYRTFSWAGDAMTNGEPTPDLHDGMGVIASRGSGDDLEVTLVRNHERAIARPILAKARYDRSTPAGQGFAPAGGTTTLRFRGRKWVSVEPSLGGTIYNCAGGATPWGTWLTCEETVIDLTAKGGRQHGYVFEVRADTGGDDRQADRRHGPHAARGGRGRSEDEDGVSHGGQSASFRFLPVHAEGRERYARELRGGRATAGGARHRETERGPAHASGRRHVSHRLGRHREAAGRVAAPCQRRRRRRPRAGRFSRPGLRAACG